MKTSRRSFFGMVAGAVAMPFAKVKAAASTLTAADMRSYREFLNRLDRIEKANRYCARWEARVELL